MTSLSVLTETRQTFCQLQIDLVFTMFVSDSSIFPSSKIKIRVCGMNGVDFVSLFNLDSTVDNMKVVALSHFFGPSDSMKEAIYHKIVLVRTGRALEDDKTLQQQGVLENGKFNLFQIRVSATCSKCSKPFDCAFP